MIIFIIMIMIIIVMIIIIFTTNMMIYNAHGHSLPGPGLTRVVVIRTAENPCYV